MTRELVEQKTAVFSFGSLAVQEEPRSYDMDELTRELPLIEGRFAGREWHAEDLRSEPAVKKTEKAAAAYGRAAAMAMAGVAAAVLLVGALVGQARLVDMNEEAVAVSGTISALREEHNSLLLRYEETDPTAEFQNIPGMLRTQYLDEALSAGAESAGEDRATVLNIRRGRELGHLWESFVDTLGASFR